jgi:hypothetical protein
MKTQFFLCSLLFVNACDAKTQENNVITTEMECQFSFEKINACFYKTKDYDITVNIEAENIASDEKSIKKLVTKVNGAQQMLSVSQDTSILNEDIGYISFADINFDKVPDLALTTSFDAPNLYLDYWIFDPKRKKYIYVGNYPEFTINNAEKILTSEIKNNAESYQQVEWHWNDNELEKR